MCRLLLIVAGLLLSCQPALAWWNADWAYRKQVTLNTTTAGAAITENQTAVAIPVRLHTGNFVFLDAKEDGSDLRLVAGDDKTPLKYHVEMFDAINELAILWVQVPRVAGNSATESIWLYYGNPEAAKGEDVKGSYDADQTLVLHFSDSDGVPHDQTVNANAVTASGITYDAAGAVGGAALFSGTSKIDVAASPGLTLTPGGNFTFSAWVKSSAAQDAVLLIQYDASGSALTIGLNQTQLYARVMGVGTAPATVAGGVLAPGAWHHVAAVIGSGKLTLYLDGVAVGSGDGSLPALAGAIALGAAADGTAGFNGALDEVQLAKVARTPDWIKLAYAAQGASGTLLTFGEDEETSGGGTSHFGILLANLTPDAWVVIIILLAMMAASFTVMVQKAKTIARIEKANKAFLERYQQQEDVTALAAGRSGAAAEAYADSALYRVYSEGIRELLHRLERYRQQGQPNLPAQAFGAIRASVDAGMVRETQRLNSRMVLLTIAISGGPFLGLFGTVLGVMITFAAIAAQGDVNINAIAPGIAAALLATVAGLGVAIPCLFGYNYLASRIKNISADMQIFADELLSRFVENYSN